MSAAESNHVAVAIGVLKGSAMALRDAQMIEAADCLSAAAEGLANQNTAPPTDCTDWPDKFWKLAMRYYQNSSPGFNHECEKLLRDFLATQSTLKLAPDRCRCARWGGEHDVQPGCPKGPSADATIGG